MKKYFHLLIEMLFPKKPSCEGSVLPPVTEHKTFTDTGEFIKAEEFILLWIENNVHGHHAATDVLTDDEYLDYRMWEDMNHEKLYKEHLPDVRVFRGENPNIIFHGGCLGCMSQRLYGLERCKDCQYFRAQCRKSDLRIEGEETATLSAAELEEILKSRKRK